MSRISVMGLAVVASLSVACSQPPAPVQAEAASLDVTSWTERTEVFAEYPPLVQGQHARFAVHLTDLRDFSALAAGRARVELTPQGGGAATFLEGGASRPGVFRAEGKIPAAGRYTMALIVDAPSVQDRHELGAVTVFADAKSAAADAEARAPAEAAGISYLKEHQWLNPFATALAVQAELPRTVRVPATIGAVTGGEAVVSAPAAGRFAADTLLPIGTVVGRSQVIGRLEPRLAEGGTDRATLVAAVAEAEATLDASRSELARAERLLNERAVPARRVEDARRAVAVADARREAAAARLAERDQALQTGGGLAAGNAFILRAPIGGRLVDVHAALGASYEEGAPLFRIMRTDEVELRAMVPAADVESVRRVAGVGFQAAGRPQAFTLTFHHMHHSGVIDEASRALALQFDVDNRNGQLLVGQTGIAILRSGDRQRTLVVPEAAVLTEAGRPFVFEQIGGETFVRRFLEIGVRDGGLVAIQSGLRLGDRVVTRGAYEVQLAAASGSLPAEGHVH